MDRERGSETGRLWWLPLAACLAACQPSAERAAADGAEAQQLLEAGQVAAAQKLVAEAIRRRDDVAGLYIVQAHVALATENSTAAYQAYANALALDAANPEALTGVAQLGIGTGHLREAERAADQMLTLNIQPAEALLVKGIGAIARSNYDGAVADADKVLAIAPDHVGGLILKSRALAMRGDRAEALTMMRAAVSRTGYTPEMTMSLAELARANGDGDEFLALLNRLKELAPARSDYRFDLIETLYKRGARDAARNETVALLTQTLKADSALDQLVRLWNAYDGEAPTDAQLAAANDTMSLEARTAIARQLVATGRPAPALALLKPLATGWSSEIDGLYARAADAAGDAGAVAAAAAVLKRDEDNGDALLVRAAHLPPTDAVIDYQRVIRDYPEWDAGYLGLAAAYRALDRPAGVRRAFEDGVRARPQSLPLTIAYLRQLAAFGDTTRALELARRFALDSPASPAAWTLYAATCRRSGGGDCKAEAAAGLAGARTRFGLDPAPGTPPPITLIGRIA